MPVIKKLAKSIGQYKRDAILTPVCVAIEGGTQVFIPLLMAKLIDEGINKGDMNNILRIGIYLLIACLISFIAGVSSGRLAARAASGFAANLRGRIFNKIQQFSFANIDKYSTAGLVTRLTTDVFNVMNSFQMLIRVAVRSPIMLIFSLVMAFGINSKLALMYLFAVPFLGVGLVLVILFAHPIFEKVFKTYDKLNNVVQENLRGIRVVKSFVRENHEIEKFSKVNDALLQKSTSALKVMLLMGPVSAVAVNVTTLAVVWFAGRQIMIGNMEIGTLTAFITYLSQILTALNFLANIILQGARAAASDKRISEVLYADIDLTDEGAAQKDKQVEDGSIEFKNVSFKYFKNNSDYVLQDANLKINGGELIGIIGSTGSGKTTLVSLIPRLYDADCGEVLVDGVNVKEYSLSNLREKIAMVLQKNTLFSGSVDENLRWGNPDATNEEIVNAAKIAQAHSFVESFEGGYDYDIGRGGANLSGGQRQRLCIARALLKKPKIIILDDSTSAVDTATDASIRHAFRTELSGVTKLIIAQRITSVIDADKIIVMDEGRIVGFGPHDELIENCETYKEIYYSQKD